MKIDRLTTTAYHEAGHVVACLAFKVQFDIVTIEPDSESLGRVAGIKSLSPDYLEKLYYSNPVLLNKDMYEKEMIISLAGVFAESLYRKKFNHIGASSDYLCVRDIAIRMFDDRTLRNAFLKYIRLQTKALIELKESVAYIEKLYPLLLEKTTLDYEFCLKLYEQYGYEEIDISTDINKPLRESKAVE